MTWSHVLDERDQRTAFLSLVDIIFAYAYDHRTTEGENNVNTGYLFVHLVDILVESGWTIRKLSATLSWLETYSGPEEVVTACYRRCLSYPLYRHWKLTARVFRDVRHIFSAGQLTFEMDCSELPRIDCVFLDTSK
ncbi:hypothetical protein NP493_1g05022 [Ridgeia piscesae]|uniref:Protein SHQ1 homolog n=1 Tax=Ridgeia piscesae TaxID=27915 RepID=A0AAD9PG87_RIDPI|nr:hypothetical protein NP493_1g05022 [Ridgeia piscesae]